MDTLFRFLIVIAICFWHLPDTLLRWFFHYHIELRKLLYSSPSRLCEQLGGAFPKIGQILSTRADLISDQVRLSLCQLQDNVAPFAGNLAADLIKKSGLNEKLKDICIEPIASGTIAQVHKASRKDDARIVALKLKRPNVRRKLEADCRIIRFWGRFVAKLPKMSSIPVNTALMEISDVLIRQTDFQQEARNYRRLHSIFANNEFVLIPELHEDLCTDDILVMDFIPNMTKLDDANLTEDTARKALIEGVRALYKMIFEEGFIHCDMHPGNVLVTIDGRLVIIDAGFMVELSDETRRSFAEFFLAIAFKDGTTAAKIIHQTALHIPSSLDVQAFEADIAELIERVGGLKAQEFQVAGFVGELFAIMRSHYIFGTSQFTIIILSLLVYEGITKHRYPELDFQQEAIPFVMAALGRE